MVQDSATSQFFINLNDNDFLNSGTRDAGYAVFGKVIKGIEIIEEMGKVQTTTKNGMDDWPVEEIIIESIELLA
jgi:peptidyl-prolyl cis-trans isomerase A (cyclophilin A)